MDDHSREEQFLSLLLVLKDYRIVQKLRSIIGNKEGKNLVFAPFYRGCRPKVDDGCEYDRADGEDREKNTRDEGQWAHEEWASQNP